MKLKASPPQTIIFGQTRISNILISASYLFQLASLKNLNTLSNTYKLNSWSWEKNKFLPKHEGYSAMVTNLGKNGIDFYWTQKQDQIAYIYTYESFQGTI